MYLQFKEQPPNILGFKIPSDVSKKRQNQICGVLAQQIRKTGKIRLILMIEPRKTGDVESLFFDLGFAYIYADNIERMALVGDKTWERTCAGLFGLFANIKATYFDRSEAKAALKWIKS